MTEKSGRQGPSAHTSAALQSSISGLPFLEQWSSLHLQRKQLHDQTVPSLDQQSLMVSPVETLNPYETSLQLCAGTASCFCFGLLYLLSDRVPQVTAERLVEAAVAAVAFL